MDITSDALLTPQETARMTGLTEANLMDRRRRRIEPAYVRLADSNRGLVRYRLSVLREWLTRNLEEGRVREVQVPEGGAVDCDGVDDPLMTPAQVANLTGFTLRALSGRRARNEEPAYIKMGSGAKARVRYRRSTIEAWLRSCEASAPAVKVGRPLDVPQAAWALGNLDQHTA